MKVVIVGGGFGGVKTALALANKPGIHVDLIVRKEHFEYHGALYRTATGRSPLEVVIPLREIFERARNVEVILDEATRIDAKRKVILGSLGDRYPYDTLVLALGSVVMYRDIPGMEEHAYAINTIEDAIRMRHALILQFKKPIKRPVRIAVIGAGPTGVELAGELKAFAHLVAEKQGTHARPVDVTLVEGSEKVLPMFSQKASTKAYKRLRKLGVHMRLNCRVDSCDPGKLCLESEDLKADVIVWTAGSQIAPFYQEQGQLFEMDHGKVIVDNYLRAKGQRHIFVIGDNAKTKFSGMAQTALHDAVYLAKNIIREHHGRKLVAYKDHPPVYVVPVGHGWAVYQHGDRIKTGYRAWRIRRRADLAIARNFLPYQQALKTWRKGNKRAKF